MAIVKTKHATGNFGTTVPSELLSAEDKNYIRVQYINTGKLKIEAPHRTVDANGNITESVRKFIFSSEEALNEYNNDPAIIAIKEKSDAIYNSMGITASTF